MSAAGPLSLLFLLGSAPCRACPGAAGPVDDASTVAPAAVEVIVRLRSDEILKGVLLEEGAGEVVIEHAVLGRLVIPRAAISTIEPVAATELAPPPPGDLAPVPTDESDPQAPSKVRGDPPRPAWATQGFELPAAPADQPPPGSIEWLANIQASLAGVNSDNDELDIRAAGGVMRRTSDDLLTFDAEYFFSMLNGETTDNNLLATLVYDRYFEPTDWLVFAKGQYQYDEFQSWENRLSAYGGLGYRLFRLPPLAVTVKLGAGATHQFGDPEQTTPEAYGEVAFVWTIDEHQRLEGGANIAPDLTDLGAYRILARLDWILRLDARGLSLIGGIREQYDSVVEGEGTHNDLRYYLGFRMDF